ncbi:single-strand DNA-binding protein [Glaciihabitans tibetensis]|uniref:Single-strand DNA-binding protein n=1 Tax=Glaciihabitans tibetensis TaxID=1266600 RepID=A0A2T0VIQ9_9MICO|nr:single-stranded DNA-binding protein [Glaciihabitans tibetensis]PRY70073.1 single-strand DNA-binding protein [Glaciihabitans tibetensis]
MPDTITLTGVVATAPHTVKTEAGLIITHFRLASNNRRFDRATQRWIDGESNFYTISAFRQMAHNVLASLVTGDRVVVTGRLKVKNWTSGDKSGTNIDVEAESIGHDLAWGQSRYTKSPKAADRDSSASEDRSASGDPASGGPASQRDVHEGLPAVPTEWAQPGVYADRIAGDADGEALSSGIDDQGDDAELDDTEGDALVDTVGGALLARVGAGSHGAGERSADTPF